MTKRSGVSALLICGSTAKRSCTRELLLALGRELESSFDVSLWDLRDAPLAFADPAFHHRPAEVPSEQARAFVHAVKAAEVVALGSPLYHGSYSGVLKNALDHLGRDAFRGKHVALLSHGSNIRKCAMPAEHLLTVVRTLHGSVVQTVVASGKSDFHFDEDGRPMLVSVEIAERIKRQAAELGTVLSVSAPMGCWTAPASVEAPPLKRMAP